MLEISIDLENVFTGHVSRNHEDVNTQEVVEQILFG